MVSSAGTAPGSTVFSCVWFPFKSSRGVQTDPAAEKFPLAASISRFFSIYSPGMLPALAFPRHRRYHGSILFEKAGEHNVQFPERLQRGGPPPGPPGPDGHQRRPDGGLRHRTPTARPRRTPSAASAAAPEADVHFLVGGTQVNLVIIDALLQSYEAVIAARDRPRQRPRDRGHRGHRPQGLHRGEPRSGKLTAGAWWSPSWPQHNGTEHMVLPRLVYISDTTEIGTLYTKAELTALRRCCRCPRTCVLYLDGARLGSALTAPRQRPDPAGPGRALTDAFYHRRHEKRRPVRGGAWCSPRLPCPTTAGT